MIESQKCGMVSAWILQHQQWAMGTEHTRMIWAVGRGWAAMAVSNSMGRAKPMRNAFLIQCAVPNVQCPEYNPDKCVTLLRWLMWVCTDLVYMFGAFPLLVISGEHEGFAKTHVKRWFWMVAATSGFYQIIVPTFGGVKKKRLSQNWAFLLSYHIITSVCVCVFL